MKRAASFQRQLLPRSPPEAEPSASYSLNMSGKQVVPAVASEGDDVPGGNVSQLSKAPLPPRLLKRPAAQGAHVTRSTGFV